MKVSELIEELSIQDPESEVCIAYNYGDYWRTTVTPLVENVETATVAYSAYHDLLSIASEDDYDKEDAKEVVVISNMRIY